MLGKEMITDPSRWQLVIELSDDELQVVAFPAGGDHDMIYERVAFAGQAESELKRIENAVYDNPLLLGDFNRVTVLYDTQRFMCVPDVVTGMGEDVTAAAFCRYFRDAGCGGEILNIAIEEMRMALAFEIPADVCGFLRRTFPGVSISHPLVPLCSYFSEKHHSSGFGKTIVSLNSGRVDVLVLGREAPLLVNSYVIREPMDAVYYILAARKTLKLTDTDEIIIGGDRIMRAQVTPVLRRYVRYVIPAIFPGVLLKAGRVALAAPFEMVLAPLVGGISRDAQI